MFIVEEILTAFSRGTRQRVFRHSLNFPYNRHALFRRETALWFRAKNVRHVLASAGRNDVFPIRARRTNSSNCACASSRENFMMATSPLHV
jgi:hypothetical protein